MSTFIHHAHRHLTHPKHLLHNVLLALGVAGLFMAVDQFYTGNYLIYAAGQTPKVNYNKRLTILPEPALDANGKVISPEALDDQGNQVLMPATNSVHGVCYIRGTDMWDPANHRVCMTAEPVCRTIKGWVIGCETKKIIR